MSDVEYMDLSDWYLARLRKRGASIVEQRLTPHTLVEKDSSLIRDLVSRVAPTRQKRAENFLNQFRMQNSRLFLVHNLILILTLSGIAVSLYFLFQAFSR